MCPKYVAGSACCSVSGAAPRSHHDDVRLTSHLRLDVLEIETESRYSCDCSENVFTLASSTMCSTHKHLEMDHKPVPMVHINKAVHSAPTLMIWSFVTHIRHVHRADLRSDHVIGRGPLSLSRRRFQGIGESIQPNKRSHLRSEVDPRDPRLSGQVLEPYVL